MTFEDSLALGPHHQLRLLEGRYRGTARTWFEPGKLGDESPIDGTLRPVLGGRFLLHEYRTSMQGQPVDGMAIYGFHLQLDRWEAAWIDSMHNGTAIMFSTGKARSVSVAGTYPAPEGPDWGWRTEIEPGEGGVILRHFNVTPTGDEALAVQIDYRRV